MNTLLMIVLMACPVLLAAWALILAPEGYEDEQGFHYGRQSFWDDCQKEL